MFADTILNLVWAAVCLAAFAWFFTSQRRRIAYRALALAIALVSLFPCVSASDDWVRLQFLGAASHSEGTPKDSSGDQPDQKALATLVRMLEALESVQVGVALALAVVLCLFALEVVPIYRSLDRFLPARAGRAPPLSIPV